MDESHLGQSWPIRMDAAGRIMVPAEARKLHGWGKDTQLVIEEGEHGALRVITFEDFLVKVQQHFIDKFGKDRSLVDELIAERKQETAHEQSGH